MSFFESSKRLPRAVNGRSERSSTTPGSKRGLVSRPEKPPGFTIVYPRESGHKVPPNSASKRESQPHASTRVYGERIAPGEGKSGQPWAAWTCQQDCRQPLVMCPTRVTPTKRRLAWSPDAGQRTESPWSSPEAERLAQRRAGLALLRKPGAPGREAAGAASRTSDAETRRARRHAAPAAKDAADQTRPRG